MHTAEPNAQPLGKLPNGKRTYRFTVRWKMVDTMSRDFASTEGTVVITAINAATAVNDVRDSRSWDNPVTIWTRGPKGGRTERFMSWEGIIGHAIMRRIHRAPTE
jgi:NMD protein affecting ribosome stability and mRNA decay